MFGLKRFLTKKTTLAIAAMSVGAIGFLAPVAQAQVSIQIGVQPVCSYGYYDYAPYQCAPVGYYGSGYFYNGIFLGMGPWAGWGYGHGWGGHRFVNDGGGRYHGGGGAGAYRAYQQRSSGGQHDNGRPGDVHQARPSAVQQRPNARPNGREARPAGQRPSAGSQRPAGGGGGHPHGGHSGDTPKL